jgi:ligand-binding sensor domain-containing protein/signal transduction histidine kinase/DNA-binding response OmpR family regulator
MLRFNPFKKFFFPIFKVLFIVWTNGNYCFAQFENLSFDNFTIENGLSNNYIHSIYQDKKGWMWFGTSQGLSRFDGYKFTIFKDDPNDPTSLEGSLVRTIFEDSYGNLWIGANGLNEFNRAKENFVQYKIPFENFTLKGKSVNAIRQDKRGLLWIGTDNGLCLFDPVTKRILKVFFHHDNDTNSLVNNVIKVIYIDWAGQLWIGTKAGLDVFDPIKSRFKHINSLNTLSKCEILDFFCDSDGKIWVGTSNEGIFIINPFTYKAEQLIIDPWNERSTSVRAIVKDNTGKYWIGTRGGLYIYSKETKEFKFYEQDERELTSICHSSIYVIFKDAKGDFWVGTRGGISYAISEKQVFRHYKALPNDNHYLNNSELYAFWMDPDGKLWIGTEKGGINVLNPKTGLFAYIQHEKSNPNSLSKNCVKVLMDDKKGNLWAGTFMGGINIINVKTGRVVKQYRHEPLNNQSVSSDIVWALFLDTKNNIWVGTESGLELFDPKTKTFIHYNDIVLNLPVNWISEDSNHDLWLGTSEDLVIYRPSTGQVKHFSLKVRMMHEDAKGRFWLTTLNKGLALFNKEKGIIKNYDETKGISNNQTYCILEDNSGYFWISTIQGLSRFDPVSGTFKNYDKLDGLQNNQFQYGACYKTPKGELIFGGIAGFNIFNPAEVKSNEYEPPVMLTDFQIFNKHVFVGHSKESILQKSISETRHIELPYDQNVITFEFAALNYAKSVKNKYSFKLEGFEKEWRDAGYQRTATYTNLNPGEYTFMVKASNNDDVWNKNNLELKIRVLPPYWKTWWFKSIIILVIFASFYLLFMFWANRTHLKHELIYERERTQKLHELDMMKVRFFTNVSHEIRTPLTLILSPLEKLLHTDMSMKEIKDHLSIMSRNAQQLLKLVNQLLDFRKIESGNLKLELSKGDMVMFVRDIVSSFAQLAQEKNIKMEFNAAERELYTFFDTDKLSKVLNNLLSNSFKFTPNGGNITVSMSLGRDDIDSKNDKGEEEKYVEIVVKDTGIGISESNLDKIFNHFFQSLNGKNQTGTGIGLALTKELVKLHRGLIFVESELGQGTKFTVRLPFDPKDDYDPILFGLHGVRDGIKLAEIYPANKTEEEITSDKILLVIDDNADVRFFIRSHFEPDFKVLEATNGKEGLSLAFRHVPDIVISDVLMPIIDGNEFCKRLKKDERTSHIPVILLTALSSKAHQIEGMVVGADDFITKPFDIALLSTKVENLLMLRRSLREKYSGEMVLQPKNITINTPDERFLQRTIENIENNITDPEFDIDRLSQAVGVSRTQMYRKLSVLTDMTVREFIKSIRLKRAAQLLEQNKMNISEVAFAVGFKDLSHFRKCFRQEFGMSASEYTSRNAAR